MEVSTTAVAPPRVPGLPNYVFDASFVLKDAAKTYDALPEHDEDHDVRYMPDEVTRDHARRMHYAAYRAHTARRHCDRRNWLGKYHNLRDRVVLGNRKLIYRAVRRRMALANRADDLIGDCHIVLIQAVAAFNPWMGIRFSTYAYTCLVRALARLTQRLASDWLARSLPLESLSDGEPHGDHDDGPVHGFPRLDEYLRDDHPLLSPREKAIIQRRFCMTEEPTGKTLEQVGRELGLSKERVRQVQATALSKLRRALLEPGA